MRPQGADRRGFYPRRPAGTARDRYRPASIAHGAVANAVRADLATRLSDDLAGVGIVWRDALPAVGRTVRTRGAGKRERNGATAITRTADGVAWFDHSSGAGGFVSEDGSSSAPGAVELERIRTAARAQRTRDEADERARQSDATARARRTWAAAAPATTHPYLAAKGVTAAGLRVDADGHLLVPRRDTSGRVVGYQRIAPDGAKRYSASTPTRGTFFGLGTVDPAATVLVAEGLATGATVHAETGHPCAVAFDAGNLRSVAELLRVKYPTVRIVLCADDDRQTAGNPGGTKAINAARAVGGCVALPPLCLCCLCTDFNDAAACERRRGAA